jgi:hypothetical protein
MAKFKCNHSGNVFEFVNEHDIKTMRTHTEYTEIIPQEVEDLVVKPKKASAKQDQPL